jgi:hypothetical protein
MFFEASCSSLGRSSVLWVGVGLVFFAFKGRDGCCRGEKSGRGERAMVKGVRSGGASALTAGRKWHKPASWDRQSCHVSGVVRWATDKGKKCLCDSGTGWLGCSAAEMVILNASGTKQVRRKMGNGGKRDGNSINKETKRNETGAANKRDCLNARSERRCK